LSTFITGATGFLGSYLAAGMLAAGEHLFVHVRCANRHDGMDRLRRALEVVSVDSITALEDRVTICPGDLSAEMLGLSKEDIELTLSSCDRYLHCGANVRFDMELEQARDVNVCGTRELLRLAKRRTSIGGLNRVDLVSTAFVAGRTSGVVFEERLDLCVEFSNTYEQSKFEAEEVAWDSMGELPICLHRPSIVVGEANSGQTTNFTALYAPIRIYAMGLWRTIPGNRDSTLDIVPVDYVRDAILELRTRPESLGRCFHITAGRERTITVGEVVSVVESFFPDRKEILFRDPERWSRLVLPILKRVPIRRLSLVAGVATAYLPYMTSNPLFDDKHARDLLDSVGIVPPAVRDYVVNLLEFAVKSDFGS
jgi:thioester reductase-like protein